jgi:hypothetical protein
MPISTIGTAGLATGGIGRSNMYAGAVLQVVNATYATSTTTASTAYSSTGLTASITPTSASSKILVLVSCVTYTNGNTRGISMQLARGATTVWGNTGAYVSYAGSSTVVSTFSLNYLDSPATTSSTTYTLKFSAPDSATVTVQWDNQTSVMTLMEISA